MSKTISQKLIYILLGIGIGLIISSSIFIIKSTDQYSEYSDEEIIRRAKELGMVFIKDVVKTDNENKEKTNKQTEEVAKDDASIKNLNNKQYVDFTIIKGETTESVSKRLFKNGLIDNVDRFNEFICEKGVEKKIIYGKYKVKKGSTYEELVELFMQIK